VKVGSLCSGYGGLELGLKMGGIDVDLRWFSEIESNAASIMEFHNPGVANLGDLIEIVFPEPVDVVTAGFPCQSVSTAGKMKGIDDERWLIEDVVRIAGEARAEWLILENVAGIFSANGGDAFSRVVSALAEGGFDAEWTCVRASDVGAPHLRLRWFCVAHADRSGYGGTENDSRVGKLGKENEHGTSEWERAWSKFEYRNSYASNSQCFKPQIPIERQVATKQIAGGFGEARRIDFGKYNIAIRRWELVVGREAPNPTDNENRLSPKFVEWLMGLPDGWVTDVIDKRRKQLEILGNGVVPQQAAFALSLLHAQRQQSAILL
jgi:DNA (cytosine-5)-methyltransferase 1